MRYDALVRHADRQKALDDALWRNFINRTGQKRFGVVQSIKGDYLLVPLPNEVFTRGEYEKLPKHYRKMSYEQIQQIRMQYDPLGHWESLSGMFSTATGELLRYILQMQLPLERWIRYELAARGFDKDSRWVGFDKAAKIWLK